MTLDQKVFDPVEQERLVQQVHLDVLSELNVGVISDQLLFEIYQAVKNGEEEHDIYVERRRDARPVHGSSFIAWEDWRSEWPRKHREEFVKPAIRRVLEKLVREPEETHEEKVTRLLSTGKYSLIGVADPEPRVQMGDIVQLVSPRPMENGKIVMLAHDHGPSWPGHWDAIPLAEDDPQIPKNPRQVRISSTLWKPDADAS